MAALALYQVPLCVSDQWVLFSVPGAHWSPGQRRGAPGRAGLVPALGPARHIKVLLDACRRPGRQRQDRASRRRRTPHQLGAIFLALSSRRPGAWPLISVQNHVLPRSARQPTMANRLVTLTGERHRDEYGQPEADTPDFRTSC
jgi:hypothetical protein